MLSLGSNLGDRAATIREAVAELDQVSGVRVTAASGLIETPALKPDGVDEEAPAYLNAIVAIRTTLRPEQLLDEISRIELDHGRVRQERWGDRTLDIDIVDFAGRQVHTERLTIPHPRAADRAFVLAPWLQVDPDAQIPGRGRVDELLAATGDSVTPFAAEPLR